MGLEPMTAFTDAVLAAWTAFLAARLFERSGGARPARLWAWAFVAAVISSLAGVAHHGSRVLFTPAVTVLCWKVVPIATGVAALCLGSAAAIAWCRPRVRVVIITILTVEFVGCIVATAISNSFLVAAVDYVPVLLGLLVGSSLNWGRPAARAIAAGIMVSFVAFAVQQSTLSIVGMDHNDIFHVIQALAMYLLYRGGAAFGEPRSEYQVGGVYVAAQA
jgi:hypothetical protein